MSVSIYRYEVPVDDQWHEFQLHGDPLAVGCRAIEVVEFWARAYRDGLAGPYRRFMVVGTGHPFPPHLHYWGTAVAPGGFLVWHLLEER